MDSIIVDHLQKDYSVFRKKPGLKGAISSLFIRKYETKQAVNDVSFSIGAGELVGFIGPNGAGKTTTLKCLSGLLYPTRGTVRVLGFDPWQRKREFLTQISLVMGQKNQLWWDLPAMDTFLLNKEMYAIDDAKFKKTVSELVDILDVSRLLTIQVRKLSLGERMKMEIIAAIIHTPNILFLDEPTIGLDVVIQKQMRDFIREYNKRYNATIVLTSHYMEDVKQLASRIIVIDHGALLFDGSLAKFIDTYGKDKILSIVLDDHVEQDQLRRLGVVLSYEYPKVTIRVPREKTKEIAALLLRKFPIDDINIEEQDIEDVVRTVFSGKTGE